MARLNPGKVTADMVDAESFPRLSSKYSVSSVPLTVVNGTQKEVGAVPETRLLNAIKKALA